MVDDRDEHGPHVDEPEPTMAELAEAARLRDALDGTSPPTELSALALGLRAAHSPGDLAPAEHAALVGRALSAPHRRGSGVVVRIAFGAASALAAAAALSVWLGSSPLDGAAAPARYESRSTASLFDAPFVRGAASERADRIAAARSADFRDNLLAARGAR